MPPADSLVIEIFTLAVNLSLHQRKKERVDSVSILSFVTCHISILLASGVPVSIDDISHIVSLRKHLRTPAAWFCRVIGIDVCTYIRLPSKECNRLDEVIRTSKQPKNPRFMEQSD